ncbi:N-acetylmuramoyl-L-alanine amidase [Sphingomonas sp. ID1715]|uniref:N-acetylmuramoyl-L-alanine amidase family protein n=1 Tax=Sphingomonas sp. ID1715 TaxID=1656898 RepID=UPI001488EADC|nr:N-acetylmuramoyl-L-alanine amidase [Sphingomonas sp. ID1715]NNM76944.1 N-acetylmuramoyl-L-alanine amidase [Sphingomonas sp. ID1715]
MTQRAKLRTWSGAAFLLLGVAALAVWTPGEAARTSGELSIPLDPPSPAPPLPGVLGPAGAPLIVIDPGHGGHDPGAKSAEGEQEKDLTLAFAKSVRDALATSGKVRVALTRTDDRFLVLSERSEMARHLGASLFLSIHADSAGEDDQAHGATLYTLSETASDTEAAQLAARENKADIVRGVNLSGRPSEVASILIDLARRESLEQATSFVRALHGEAKGALPFRADYHRQASLVVLKAPDVPSVLFETGYITNASDRGLLSSAEGRTRVAIAVARAVEKQLIPVSNR